jgi:Ca2+-binding RTX toxin-like protein
MTERERRVADYIGDSGANKLIGGTGDDRIIGRGGKDTLTGGAGNDVFVYDTRGFGQDTITDFNTNGDRIDLSFLNIADFDTLKPFIHQSGAHAFITLGWNGSTESIYLSNVSLGSLSASDFIFNTSTSDLTVDGTGSWDALFGGAGNDTINGGAGNDTISGGGGNDTISGGGGGQIFGGDGNDTISGGSVIYEGSDIYGGSGDDIIDSGDGTDILRGGAGADVLIGGGGTDAASYYGTSGAVTVNLQTGTGIGGEAQGDTLSGIEDVTGGKGGDKLTGDAGANVLAGYEGNDTLAGGGGADHLVGGVGNDLLRGDAGADHLAGGLGSDTVTYWGTDTAVTVNLRTGTASGGDAQGDSLDSVENVNGSKGGDSLTGNSSANLLAGYEGNDTLQGEDGTDILAGGTGADRFVYESIIDSVVGANADQITDFSHAQADKIDLSLIDANTALADNQAFIFIGSGLYTGVAGQLRFAQSGGNTTIAGDVNGDGTSDFHIVLMRTTIALQASDFVL